MEFKDWLNGHMQRLELNSLSLAEAIEENQPTIYRISTGETKNPRLRIIKKLENFFNEKFTTESSSIDSLPDNSYEVDRRKMAYPPVYGKAMGGLPDRLFTDEDRLINGHDQFGEVYSQDQKAFITKVDGNSMFPKYFHGGFALVEPSIDIDIEDEVLIKVNTGQVMLKKLISRRGGIVLGSYNEPEIYTYEESEIIWMYYVAYPVPVKKIKNRI